MCSVKSTILIFLLVISFCFAQDESRGQEIARKRYKHKLHHLHHNPYFYYLAFLAIKLKFAFVIGTMIMLALFASKTYALIKYGILTQKNKEPEKIYIQAPDHHYPSYFSSEDHDHGHEFSSSDSGTSYGRSFENDVYNNYAFIHDLVNKFDLNEMTFNSLDIKDDECKQRFVCEANMRAKNDTLLNIGMFLVRDKSFIKYQTSKTINTLAECADLCNLTI